MGRKGGRGGEKLGPESFRCSQGPSCSSGAARGALPEPGFVSQPSEGSRECSAQQKVVSPSLPGIGMGLGLP